MTADTDTSSGWASRIAGGLRATSDRIAGNLGGALGALGANRLTNDQLDNLEDALISSDLGPRAAGRIRAKLADTRFERGIDETAIREAMAEEIAAILRPVAKPLQITNNDNARCSRSQLSGTGKPRR